MLKGNDRPRRNLNNNQNEVNNNLNEVNLKLPVICKQVIAMVKSIKCMSNDVFNSSRISEQLNNSNDLKSPCEDVIVDAAIDNISLNNVQNVIATNISELNVTNNPIIIENNLLINSVLLPTNVSLGASKSENSNKDYYFKDCLK